MCLCASCLHHPQTHWHASHGWQSEVVVCHISRGTWDMNGDAISGHRPHLLVASKGGSNGAWHSRNCMNWLKNAMAFFDLPNAPLYSFGTQKLDFPHWRCHKTQWNEFWQTKQCKQLWPWQKTDLHKSCWLVGQKRLTVIRTMTRIFCVVCRSAHCNLK